MLRKTIKAISGVLIASAMLVGVNLMILSPVSADISLPQCSSNNNPLQNGASCAKGNNQPSQLFGGDASIFRRVVNIMLFVVGAIAVIMLIVGGIRYVVSGGNQTQVTAAKNTILYAIVGIVVAFLAFAVVDFVLKALGGNVSQ